MKRNQIQQNIGETDREISLIGGALFASYGLFRRSPLLILIGGMLLFRGATRFCLAYRLLGITTRQESGRLPPSIPAENSIEPDDIVDRAVWQTFPASDPPGNY